MAVHPFDTGDQAARALRVQNQEMRDFRGCHLAPIGPMECPMRRHGAQKRGPLVVIKARPHKFHFWQKDVILHIHQTRRVIGPFQIEPKVQEIPTIIAEQRGINRTAHHRRMAHHPFGKPRQFQFAARLAFHRAQFLKRGVQRIPHLRGQRRAHDPPVFARSRQATGDRAGIIAIKEQPAFQIALHRLPVFLGKGIRRATGRQERIPFVPIPRRRWQQRDARPDLEQSSRRFGAFDIAGDPEQIICGST